MKLLHRIFPNLHRWTVVWSDDDECRRCGATRYWPSGVVVWLTAADYRTGRAR